MYNAVGCDASAMQASQVYLGTSGFSFDDWRGPVYPERLPRPQWLIYYEQQLGFNALEINYTYYQLPSPRTLEGLIKKTTPRFRFTIKTHRSMTHDVLRPGGSLAGNPGAFAAFREGMKPLVQSGRLGCVLAQFPYGFSNTPKHRDYLSVTIDRLADLTLVVEFRHNSWVAPQTLAYLKQRQVGWCVVDEPRLPRLMPWVGEATSESGYVRFHGRNAEQWFGTSTEERYHYLYRDSELRELVERSAEVAKQVKTLFVFFNNCHAGGAARNAGQFKALLVERGLLPNDPQPSRLFPVT